MKRLCLLFAMFVTLTGLSQASFQGPDKEFLLDTLARPSYPPGPITRDDNFKHLFGLPSFVEITPQGSAMIMQQDTVHVSLNAWFSGADKPVRLYTLNHNFFCRAKNPGLYKPDYLAYTRPEERAPGSKWPKDRYYYAAAPFMEKMRTDLAEQWKSSLHGTVVFDIDRLHKKMVIYNPECDFSRCGDLSQVQGELTHIGAELWFGDNCVWTDQNDQFPSLVFHENIRGIVFTIDGDVDGRMFLPKTRELTWTDIEYMKLKGELKFQVK